MREDVRERRLVWTERFVCAVYFIAFFVMAVMLMVYQPHIDHVSDVPVSPPDEYFRMLIPKFICEHGTLPTGLEEEVRITGYGFSYGLYNVLPYIIQGYCMRLVNVFTDSQLALLYAGRMVNVVFGLLMAWVVYLLGKRVFKDNRFRWLFCFAVMYLPENLFVHTYINTDSCCLLSTAMILYALVCAYQDGFNCKNSIWLGSGIILCALSYYNAYGYILSSMILFVGYFLKKQGKWSFDWKSMLKYGIFISVLVVVGAGWWFVRAYFVLDGDILGLKTREHLALLYASEETSPLNTYQARGISVWQMLKENYFFQCVYVNFIAVFGSVCITGNRWTYLSYKLFFAAGVLGWGTAWIFDKGMRKISGRRIFFHLNMLFCAILPLAFMIRYAYTMDYQPQGRYILPSLIPLMYYAVRGMERLAGLKVKHFELPRFVGNAGVALALFIATGSAVYMVFCRALPVYLELGMMY